MQEDELRFWANAHAPAGSEVAMAVLELFGKMDSLRAEVQKAPVLDRAHELKEAENRAFRKLIETEPMQPDLKPFDGSTGTPEHGRCGRKENTPPGQ